jgi:hypothetical protein
MIARKRLDEDCEEVMLRERRYMPPGDIRTRCAECGKDNSVQWVICALSQMYSEECWQVWQFLRKHQPLLDFREMRKRQRVAKRAKRRQR